jgi:hypothetical protein
MNPQKSGLVNMWSMNGFEYGSRYNPQVIKKQPSTMHACPKITSPVRPGSHPRKINPAPTKSGITLPVLPLKTRPANPRSTSTIPRINPIQPFGFICFLPFYKYLEFTYSHLTTYNTTFFRFHRWIFFWPKSLPRYIFPSDERILYQFLIVSRRSYFPQTAWNTYPYHHRQ